MKNIIRKSAGLILGFTLMVGTSVPSFAAIDTTKIQVATEMADKLSELDLFHGTENGYELDREGTRTESIAMLIRLLGEDGKIKKSGTVWNDFTDVPNWAKYYVEYAYSKGYSYGVSHTKFGSNDNTTAAQYITFVLRALGYDGNLEGYTWDNPFSFAETIGLIEKGEYSKNSEFLRADMVIISYRALDTKYNNGNTTLRKKLANDKSNNEEKPWEGDPRDAGTFSTTDDKLVVVNKDADFQSNMGRLNGMLGNTYLLTYTPDMTQDGTTFLGAELMYQRDSNRYGLRISWWRQSYDSAINENEMLNAILETFYFECGNKKVSHALWSFIDSSAINNKANSDDFGFTDVASLENGGTITMDGITLDFTNVNGVVTVIFH